MNSDKKSHSSTVSPFLKFQNHDDLSRFLTEYYLEKLNPKNKKAPETIINSTFPYSNLGNLHAK